MSSYFRLMPDYKNLDIYIKQKNNLSRKVVTNRGVPVKESPEQPFVFLVEADEQGVDVVIPPFSSAGPIFSVDIVNDLQKNGVDNIEVFDAVFVDSSSNQTIESNHKVVNILGRVKCANLDNSKYESIAGSQYFHKVEIDIDEARGLKLFRLQEMPTTIVIHESLKEIFSERIDRFVLETA